MPPQGAQSIRELFVDYGGANGDTPPTITLSALALSLNVPVSRLIPLAEHRYLRVRSEGEFSGSTYVDALPEPALRWMRQWFMPARAKLLFSMGDVVELMKLPSRRILAIAAANDVPVVYDEALGGHVFSAWSVKRLMTIRVLPTTRGKSATGQPDGERFDRQALLWRIMEGDPQRAGKLPNFDEALEEEIERVSKLEEPMRGLRTRKLMDAFRQARLVAAAVELPVAEIIDCEDRLERLKAG